MLIDIKPEKKNIEFNVVISGNDQPQVEVNFSLSKPTIKIDIDLNYSVINTNITQNITNNYYSLLTFLPTDIC